MDGWMDQSSDWTGYKISFRRLRWSAPVLTVVKWMVHKWLQQGSLRLTDNVAIPWWWWGWYVRRNEWSSIIEWCRCGWWLWLLCSKYNHVSIITNPVVVNEELNLNWARQSSPPDMKRVIKRYILYQKRRKEAIQKGLSVEPNFHDRDDDEDFDDPPDPNHPK